MGYMVRNGMFSKLFASHLDQSATSEDRQATRAQMVCKKFARGLSPIYECVGTQQQSSDDVLKSNEVD